MQRQTEAPEKTLKECAVLYQSYPKLVDKFIKADQGDPYALAQLGLCFVEDVADLEESKIIPKNKKRGFQLMKQAAEKDYALAQGYLAWFYTDGIGVDKNDKEAFNWVKKAAEHQAGDGWAHQNLANLYEIGRGVEKDEKQALIHFEAAAKKGHGQASYKAGWYYENAIGTPQDLKKALEYYELAASKGDLSGKEGKLVWYIRNGRKPEIIELAKEIAELKDIQEGKPDSDNPTTNYARFLCCNHGFGVAEDQTKALHYLLLAANKKHPRACYYLAEWYRTGSLVKEDGQAALKYYEIAAQKQYTAAYIGIATLYQKGGPGLPADENKSYELFAKGCVIDTRPEVLQQVIYYYAKLLKPADWKKAMECALKGAESNDGYCLIALGEIYHFGHANVGINLTKAKEYYEKAKHAGLPQANACLETLAKQIEAEKLKTEEMRATQLKNEEKKAAQSKNPHPTFKFIYDQLNKTDLKNSAYYDYSEPGIDDYLVGTGIDAEAEAKIVKEAWDWETKAPINAKKAREKYEEAKKLGISFAITRLNLFATMSSLPANMSIAYQDCDFVKQLGKGAFSTVYETNLHYSTNFDLKPGVIAVKKPKVVDEFSLQCFNAETQVVKLNLNSPNIVKYIGVCLSPPMIAMEKLNGSLSDYILKNKFDHKDPIKYYQIAKSIANGIADFHKLSFIHRDIKPDNILFDDKMTPKLIDFGFAMLETANAPRRSGTIRYQAPELFEYNPNIGWNFSKKSDIYALGMTFFNLVSGEFPYVSYTEEEVKKVIKEGHRPRFPKNCPDSVAQLITKCWQADPKRRPTAIQVVETLDGMIKKHKPK